MTSETEHDVILVGASFAGLATAYFTKGEKIIFERKRARGG
jgi:ribulose 1,5-bisphosphate synthetase/thiazole synthase